MSTQLFERIFARPEENVGRSDFGTRALASMALFGLLALQVPQFAVGYSPIKICLLIASELGLISLMLGLFLRAKTYFAGLQLIVASLAMLWFQKKGLPYVALGVGTFFFAWGMVNLLTRRSRLNALLNLGSLHAVITEATLSHAQLEKPLSVAAPPQPPNPGESR